MNKKEKILVNSFILFLVFGFGSMTVLLSTSGNIGSLFGARLQPTKNAAVVHSQNDGCGSDKPVLNISNADDVHLAKLSAYQELCGSYVTDKWMVFGRFVEDADDARTYAAEVADKLRKFHDAGVRPVMIIEPYIRSEAMSYSQFLNGKYDKPLALFFDELKRLSVTDDMMGTWVPFPESNTPSWNNKDTEPADFARAVNKYLRAMKAVFPAADGSILLNATTYDPNDAQWENGDYIGLDSYIQEIDHSLVSSFGVQGFPWIARSESRTPPILSPDEFLQPELVINAAQELRTRDIWVNTGTFISKYTGTESQAVMTAGQRREILSNILQTVQSIQDYQQNEYRVSINLFAEDKSTKNEKTDWSYMAASDHKAVLVEFISKLHEAQIDFSLFDQ